MKMKIPMGPKITKVKAYFIYTTLFFSLTSCLEKETVIPEYAYFSIYHASPDAEDVDVFLDQGKVNTNDFAYGDYSNGYLFTNPGTHKLKLVDADITTSIIMDTTLSFIKNEYHSVFFIGLSDQWETLLIKDVPSSAEAATDEAFIRFIHLAPDAATVNVYADEQIIFTSLSYKENSAFRKINVNDEFDLTIKESSETATVILSKEEIDLTAKRYYTVVFKGLTSPPQGSTDGLDVEIIKN